jgi:hypothetical protein
MRDSPQQVTARNTVQIRQNSLHHCGADRELLTLSSCPVLNVVDHQQEPASTTRVRAQQGGSE